MGHFSSPYFWFVDLPFSVVPVIVAARRRCKNQFSIYLLSFFLGWTVIGGLAALFWALWGETLPQEMPKNGSARL
jgi:Superinfection immunity protein